MTQKGPQPPPPASVTRIHVPETSSTSTSSSKQQVTKAVRQEEIAVSNESIIKNQPFSMLVDILSRCRGGGSSEEEFFVDQWLMPKLPKNAWKDKYGNVHCSIGKGDQLETLFSCHTDTVHRNKDFASQVVLLDSARDELCIGKGADCLGADDGAGIWIMISMITARIPGYYIFHREEESGGRGSRWIRDNMTERLKKIKRAIAFDRKGTNSVITHQGTRTCSDEFAQAIAKALNDINPSFKFKPDPTGSFTDTKTYAGIIPECTNLSVGYYRQHSCNEYLDYRFTQDVLRAAMEIDWSKLPVTRDPEKDDEHRRTYRSGNGSSGAPSSAPSPSKPVASKPANDAGKNVGDDLDDIRPPLSRLEAMILVKRWPKVVVQLLEYSDLSWDDVEEAMLDHYGNELSIIGGVGDGDDFPDDFFPMTL